MSNRMKQLLALLVLLTILPAPVWATVYINASLEAAAVDTELTDGGTYESLRAWLTTRPALTGDALDAYVDLVEVTLGFTQLLQHQLDRLDAGLPIDLMRRGAEVAGLRTKLMNWNGRESRLRDLRAYIEQYIAESGWPS